MSEFVIETQELTKIYGEQICVDSVSLHVRKGTIYGLLGRNGAGKTTVMKMILGLTEPTKGEIRVFDTSLEEHMEEILPRIGALIETPGFYPNLTATENLKIMARVRKIDKKKIKEVLDLVGLPYNDKKLYKAFSMGMKQRLGIANALIHNPEILILDEPINGLDPIGIQEIRKFILKLSREGKTIILSSHILSEIELIADDIGIINNGKLLVESTYEELNKEARSCILLQVSGWEKAIQVLQNQIGIKDYEIEGENLIKIYDKGHDIAEYTKILYDNEIFIMSANVHNDNLEDYFKKITGGSGIA
ncbi:ABC transporter ATP-binding protein [Holdemanella porci]|uniref:ABC transporter ATP-binding protein n=1 Tax=Holdemanella porci TaxID=2652276 RepID=UPI003890CE94